MSQSRMEGPVREWRRECEDCRTPFLHIGVRQSKSRLCQTCREVAKATRMSEYHAGPYLERGRENRKRYRKEKPEITRARDKRSRIKWAERRAEQTRAWKRANRQRVRQMEAAWKAANKVKVAEHSRAWRIRLRGVEQEEYGGLAAIFERDDGLCAYCGTVTHRGYPRDDTQASIDHVAPLVAGGPDVAWNVVLACRLCNNRKCTTHFEAALARWSPREAEGA